MANTTPQQLQDLVSHLISSAKTYNGSDSIEDTENRAAIRNVARQIFLSMSTTDDMSWYYAGYMTELVAMKVCLKLGVYRVLPEDGAMPLEDIATAVNATPSFLERMLRGLDQTRNGEYKHTRLSLEYRDPYTSHACAYFQTIYDVYLKPCLTMDDDIDRQTSGLYDEPKSNFDNPFVNYFGKKGENTWHLMASKPEMMKVFQNCMAMVECISPPSGPHYDFNQFKATSSDPDRIQIVDIGGGIGEVLGRILDASPELDPTKCVLEDVEGVIGIAAEARKRGVQTRAINFMEDQPVKGAKAYYMRHVTHDYADAELITILGHIADAMAPDSKLLIADCVIPARLTEATINAGILDQIMFSIGGRERTAEAFRSVIGKAGLEVVSINRVPGKTGAVVESMKKRNSLD